MSAEELDPRPYFTLTNEYPRHRKVRGLSDKAFRLHVTLIALANEERNNGHVLGIDADMFGPRPRKELITAGLLHEAADGYQPVSYTHLRAHETRSASTSTRSARLEPSEGRSPTTSATTRTRASTTHPANTATPLRRTWTGTETPSSRPVCFKHLLEATA